MQLFTNGREFITTLKVLSTRFESGNDSLSREYTLLPVFRAEGVLRSQCETSGLYALSLCCPWNHIRETDTADLT